jgi:hypothetical protein
MIGIAKGLAASLIGGMLLAGGALAEAATFTDNTFGSVDSGSFDRAIVVAGVGTISSVRVFVDFSKCDDPNPGPAATGCIGTGSSFNNEIQLQLISPEDTVVTLVAFNTYPNNGLEGARIEVLFDDNAATEVGGGALLDGTFSPVGSLSDFIGEDADGAWALRVADGAGGDPLQLYGVTLCINEQGECAGVAPPPPGVPAPASLLLLGLGLTSLGWIRRRI